MAGQHNAQRAANFLKITYYRGPMSSTLAPAPTVSGDVLALLRRDWQRHLRNLNRAANTQRIYDPVGVHGQRCLQGPVAVVEMDGRRGGGRRLADGADLATVRAGEGRAVLSIEQMRTLLDSCKGRELVPLRDTAIIRLLLDSGGRFSEVAALGVDDVDFEMDVAHAVGKGRRPRALPFGDKTGAALARYLRARARDKQASRAELWLAEKGKGPLSAGGIKQMLKRRGKALDPPIPGLHAHMFRHTAG